MRHRQYPPFTRKPIPKKRSQTAFPALELGIPKDAPALVSVALMEMPRLGRLERMPAETAISNPVSRPAGAAAADEVRSRSRRTAAFEQTMIPAMARIVPRR